MLNQRQKILNAWSIVLALSIQYVYILFIVFNSISPYGCLYPWIELHPPFNMFTNSWSFLTLYLCADIFIDLYFSKENKEIYNGDARVRTSYFFISIMTALPIKLHSHFHILISVFSITFNLISLAHIKKNCIFNFFNYFLVSSHIVMWILCIKMFDELSQKITNISNWVNKHILCEFIVIPDQLLF